MTKEWIICIIIIILVISLNSITQNYTSIMGEWKKKFNTLAYFIEHDELEKAETELTGLKANIEVDDYEQAVSELEKAIFILNHIKDKFKLEIKNVF